MFKNKSVQVKLVKDPKQETVPAVNRRLTPEELEWLKQMAITVGLFYLAKVSIDVALTIYLRNYNATNE